MGSIGCGLGSVMLGSMDIHSFCSRSVHVLFTGGMAAQNGLSFCEWDRLYLALGVTRAWLLWSLGVGEVTHQPIVIIYIVMSVIWGVHVFYRRCVWCEIQARHMEWPFVLYLASSCGQLEEWSKPVSGVQILKALWHFSCSPAGPGPT